MIIHYLNSAVQTQRSALDAVFFTWFAYYWKIVQSFATTACYGSHPGDLCGTNTKSPLAVWFLIFVCVSPACRWLNQPFISVQPIHFHNSFQKWKSRKGNNRYKCVDNSKTSLCLTCLFWVVWLKMFYYEVFLSETVLKMTKSGKKLGMDFIHSAHIDMSLF